MPARAKHLGTLPTSTPAFVSIAELPATATTPKLRVLIKSYLRSDVVKHGLTLSVYSERTALVRLSNDRSGRLARLLSANVTPSCLSFTLTHAPGVSAHELPRPMPLWRAAAITSQLVSALKRVHSADIVHADVSLRNVIVDTARNDAVCLVDFNACFIRGHPTRDASHTTSAHVLPPELLNGGLADPAADIWALGVFVWALLFGGSGPFAAETDAAVLTNVQRMADSTFCIQEKFRKACVSIGVEFDAEMEDVLSFIEECLAPDPERRFASWKRKAQLHISWKNVIDYDRIRAHPFLMH